MRSNLRNLVITICVVLLLPRLALADLTIKMTIKEGTKTETHYTMRFKGNRQRDEYENERRGPAYVSIFQCDKKQVVGINLTRQQYFVNRLGWSTSSLMAFNGSQLPPTLPVRLHYKGSVNQTVTVTDTGERREMFGFIARHIKTATTWDARPSCRQTKLREETDGWYIDLLYGVECSPDLSGLSSQAYAAPYSKCNEHYNKNRYEFHSQTNGEARFGFPLIKTRKVYSDQGKPLVSYQEVVELSKTELDQSLFEVPAGFAQIPIRENKPSLIDRVFSLIGRR
jgi:hypothetical protein